MVRDKKELLLGLVETNILESIKIINDGTEHITTKTEKSNTFM